MAAPRHKRWPNKDAAFAVSLESVLATGKRVCVAYPGYYEIRVRRCHLTLIETYPWPHKDVQCTQATLLTIDDLTEQ